MSLILKNWRESRRSRKSVRKVCVLQEKSMVVAADKLKEEAEKNGTKVRTELVVSTGEENVWTKIAAILENAPIIDSIREASKKVCFPRRLLED